MSAKEECCDTQCLDLNEVKMLTTIHYHKIYKNLITLSNTQLIQRGKKNAKCTSARPKTNNKKTTSIIPKILQGTMSPDLSIHIYKCQSKESQRKNKASEAPGSVRAG